MKACRIKDAQLSTDNNESIITSGQTRGRFLAGWTPSYSTSQIKMHGTLKTHLLWHRAEGLN